jgi:hypothetical protein
MPMATQNQSLSTIYNTLCNQQDALSAEIQQTTNPQLAATIATEIQEIAHRIILVQNLLFAADSAQLTDMAANVQTASNNVTQAIMLIGQAAGFLNSVSSYLADVDQAIDLAKTLAAAAAKVTV